MVTHLRATERHLPYGIRRCYLPPDTGEQGPALTPARRTGGVLDFEYPEEWKADLRNKYQQHWSVNRHNAGCTCHVFVVWQCKLVPGWVSTKETEISAALRALWPRNDFTLSTRHAIAMRSHYHARTASNQIINIQLDYDARNLLRFSDVPMFTFLMPTKSWISGAVTSC